MAKFLVLNGPNLNILGRRLPGIYGTKTLEEINREVEDRAKFLGVEVAFYQSNIEGHLIDSIQDNWGHIQGIIINPGGLTYSGYSLKDALIDSGVPVIEVHLSNIFSREDWRRHSIIADIAQGQIAGFGSRSYTAALDIIAAIAKEEGP